MIKFEVHQKNQPSSEFNLVYEEIKRCRSAARKYMILLVLNKEKGRVRSKNYIFLAGEEVTRYKNLITDEVEVVVKVTFF